MPPSGSARSAATVSVEHSARFGYRRGQRRATRDGRNHDPVGVVVVVVGALVVVGAEGGGGGGGGEGGGRARGGGRVRGRGRKRGLVVVGALVVIGAEVVARSPAGPSSTQLAAASVMATTIAARHPLTRATVLDTGVPFVAGRRPDAAFSRAGGGARSGRAGGGTR